MDEFVKIFMEEAKERIERLERLILLPEPPWDELIREAHTLKGSSRMVGLDDIGEKAHRLEDELIKIKKGKIPWNDEERRKAIRLIKLIKGEKVEEERFETVRVDPEILDRISALIDTLYLETLSLYRMGRKETISILRGLREVEIELSRLQLVPLQPFLENFRSLVHDVAERKGKKVRFEVDAGDVKLDRRIIENLGEPLTHLLRNAVDHGIEPSEERERMGKPEEGLVSIRAKRKGEKIEVVVEDDGRGIDEEELKKRAVEEGLLREGEEIGRNMLFSFLFYTGFSTRKEVDEVSGRGVGMDVVKRVIEGCGGEVRVETEKGKGSRIILSLPPLISTMHILLVGAGDYTVGVPAASILRVVPKEKTMEFEGKEWIGWNGRNIQVVDLGELFSGRKTGRHVLIHSSLLYAFGVERIEGKEEVVLRKKEGLPSFYLGYTFLESERIVPVIDLVNLLKDEYKGTDS